MWLCLWWSKRPFLLHNCNNYLFSLRSGTTDAWLHLFLLTELLNKGFKILLMFTNMPVCYYVDSNTDVDFPFCSHQFKKKRSAYKDEHWIKVQDSALFWSGLWCLKRITWQTSSITVSYLAVLSTGCFKTWWNSPQIQVLSMSGKASQTRKQRY